MDPDATLNDLRNLIEQFDVTPYSEDAAAIADSAIEKFKALDAWLSSGGFLPTSWDLSVKRPAVTHEEIWCDRCAKGDHNFNHPTKGPIDHCACCGLAKDA